MESQKLVWKRIEWTHQRILELHRLYPEIGFVFLRTDDKGVERLLRGELTKEESKRPEIAHARNAAWTQILWDLGKWYHRPPELMFSTIQHEDKSWDFYLTTTPYREPSNDQSRITTAWLDFTDIAEEMTAAISPDIVPHRVMNRLWTQLALSTMSNQVVSNEIWALRLCDKPDFFVTNVEYSGDYNLFLAMALAFEQCVSDPKILLSASHSTRNLEFINNSPTPDLPSYLSSEITKKLGFSPSTLNRYAKSAGVKTPPVGGREHRYSVNEVLEICEFTLNRNRSEVVKLAAKELIQEARMILKSSPVRH